MQMLRLLVALSALQLGAEEFLRRQAETRQRFACQVCQVGVGLHGNLAEQRFKWENQTGQMLNAANIDMERVI